MRRHHIRNPRSTDKRNYLIRLLISILMVIAGALVVALTDQTKGTPFFVLQQFGLALMVAGAVSFVHEILVERFQALGEKCPMSPIPQPGIEMLAPQRQGDPRYHKWTLAITSQDLFFAGRSVLHRIEADLDCRRFPPLEKILIRKLNEGSRIRVLFCSPTWELIPDLATQEDQPANSLYADLATSLGVVNRLWQKLQNDQAKGQVEIALYREQLQYAYHKTADLDGDNVEMFVGFYFAKRLGCRSPLFEVTDPSVQTEFEDHFDTVFKRATRLLTYPPLGQGKQFNDELFAACREFLCACIGAEEVKKRIG